MTMPFEVVKTRQQIEGNSQLTHSRVSHTSSVVSCMRDTVRQNGMRGGRTMATLCFITLLSRPLLWCSSDDAPVRYPFACLLLLVIIGLLLLCRWKGWDPLWNLWTTEAALPSKAYHSHDSLIMEMNLSCSALLAGSVAGCLEVSILP